MLCIPIKLKISKQITTSGNVLHKNNFWKKSRAAPHSTHQTVLKFLARLKYSDSYTRPKTNSWFSLRNVWLFRQSLPPCLTQRVLSFLLPRVFRNLFEYFKGALQTAVYAVFRYFCFLPCYFTGMWIIFDPLDICQFWSWDYNILYDNVLHANIGRGAPAKTPFHSYLLAFFQ